MWNKYTKEVALALKTVAPILLFLLIFSEGLLSNSVSAQTRHETDKLRSSDTGKDTNDVDIILHELGWTDLFDLEVVTVSKKKEKFFETASALFVVTQEDIRRSGATNVPDALRMVPGVEVIRIDAARWYVSIRGYNHEFANKLLVLVNGRSVYSETLSGVFWKRLSSTIENIERIEVIRGPGGSIWGANAVNGVINIITRKSADTQGDLLTARWGNREDGASYTHGAKVGKDTYYRASLEYDRYDWFSKGSDTLTFQGTDNIYLHKVQDDLHSLNGSFRIDSKLNSENNLTIHGGGYQTEYNSWEFEDWGDPAVTDKSEDDWGGHLGAALDHTFSETSDMTLQFYVDHSEGDTTDPIRMKLTIVDAELKHSIKTGGHEFVWGLGARNVRDEVEEPEGVSWVKSSFDKKESYNKYNIFIQDSIWLKPERFKVTAGVKWEENSFTGSDYMPNLRLLYTPNDKNSFWVSASRSVRVPTRSEVEGGIGPGPFGNGFLNMEDPESEKITAYEFGYRARPSEKWWFDLALFRHEYDNLIATEITLPPPPPPTIRLNNEGKGDSYGAELALSWDVNKQWTLKPAYSYFRGHIDTAPGRKAPYEERNVENQFSIRSLYDVSDTIELDLWYKVVDGPGVIGGNYDFLDACINYQVKPNLNVSIVGQNLLDTNSEWLVDSYHKIERSFYVKLSWEL